MRYKNKEGYASWEKGTVKLRHQFLKITFVLLEYNNPKSMILLEKQYKRYKSILQTIDSN